MSKLKCFVGAQHEITGSRTEGQTDLRKTLLRYSQPNGVKGATDCSKKDIFIQRHTGPRGDSTDHHITNISNSGLKRTKQWASTMFHATDFSSTERSPLHLF